MIGSYLEELTTLENMQPKDRLEQDLIFLKNIFKKIILHHFFFFLKEKKNPKPSFPFLHSLPWIVARNGLILQLFRILQNS